MSRTTKFCVACLVGTAMVIGAGNVSAATTWSGAGNSTDWNDPANWTGGSVQETDGTVATVIDAESGTGLIPEFDDANGAGAFIVASMKNRGSGNPSEPLNLPIDDPLDFFPEITGAAVAQRAFIGVDTDGFDFQRLAKLTVSGPDALLEVLGTGGADFFLGTSNSAIPTATDANITLLRIENGGKIQVGSVLHPDVNGGLLPTAASQLHWRAGKINIEIDGPGSELNISDALRATGKLSQGTGPQLGSGITISNGGLLETGNFRIGRVNNLGFLDIVGPDSSLLAHSAQVFNHDLEDGSNPEHPELHGPGETIDNDAPLRDKLLHLVKSGIIIADGGDPAMRVKIVMEGTSARLTSAPIPEPSTVVLLGMAFAGFAVRRRR